MISVNNHLIENTFFSVFILTKILLQWNMLRKFVFEIKAIFPAKNNSLSKLDYI